MRTDHGALLHVAIEEARGGLEEALTPLEPDGSDDQNGEPIPTPPG